MKVKIDKSFEKDVKKIRGKAILKKIAETIVYTQEAIYIKDIRGLKKLKGATNEYSIRIKDYRIGVIISKTTVEFIRCLHRKDIYKYFPS